MVSCKCNFKKGRCEKHHNTCRVHCLLCNPLSQRRKRGGQTQGESAGPAEPKRRSAPTRDAVRNIVSLVEVEEHEGLVEENPDVVFTNNQWDGTHRSLLSFLQLQHLRKLMPTEDYRNGGGTKMHLGGHAWDKYMRAIRRVVKEIFDTMIPDGSAEALKDLLVGDNSDADPVLESLCKHAIGSKKGSIERRSLYAALGAVLSERQIVNLGKRVGVKMPKLDSNAIQRAWHDSLTIMSSKPLAKTIIRRKRFDEDVVKEALRFLLSEDYVGVLSWGTKKVKLDSDEVVELPSLVRKKTRTTMFNEYCEWFREHHDEDANHLPRTAVFEILGLVTNGQKRALTAVNTMLGNLIYDNFIVVDRIISYYTRPLRHRELRLHAVITSNFLKNQYMKHVRSDDQGKKVCTHGLRYALRRKTDESQNKLSMDCNACKFVPFFFEELRNEVKECGATYQSFENETGEEEVLGEDHAITAINRCENLVDLWSGHCARVANQRHAIAQLHSKLEDDAFDFRLTKPHDIICVMDFKMKYQPKYYRQTAIEHFGKRGTSWHGFLVIFCVYNPETKTVSREHVYCDQILQGTNLQDGYAVAACIEAFLLQLRTEDMFSDVERVTLQSDNASCYHSKELILALPFIGMTTALAIVRYIHTETCDGKCLIDAHFAMAMLHLARYIAEGNNASSPREVFLGLVSNSGIQNSFAQLIEIDRSLPHLRSEKVAGVLEALSIVTRQNEIVFTPIPFSDATIFDKADPYQWAGEIQMKTWEFSSTSKPVVFMVDARLGTVTVESGNVEDVCQDNTADDEEFIDGDAVEADPPSNSGPTGLPDSQHEPAVGTQDTGVQNNTSTSFGARVTHYKTLGKLRHVRLYESQQRKKKAEARLRYAGGGAFGVNFDELSDVESTDSDSDNMNESDDSESSASSFEGGQAAERKDLVAYAVRFTNNLINDPNSPILLRDGTKEQPEYMLAANFDVSNNLKEQGFGRRQRSGLRLGATNAKPYRKAIALIVQNEGTDKQHRSWILDKLRETEGCQYRLDLPTTEDVNKELKRCIRFKAKAASEGNSAPDLVKMMENVPDPLAEVYSNFIDETLSKDLDNSPLPREFIEVAITHFSQTDAPLEDEELVARVKSIYTSRRSTRRRAKASGQSVGSTRPRQRGKSMPNVTGVYRDFIVHDITKNQTKPAQCWKNLCEQFTDTDGNKPADFPEQAKALTYIRNLRSKHLKSGSQAAQAILVDDTTSQQ